jgi:hypothetical protein
VTVSGQLRARVEKQSGYRCGYCQSAQKYVMGRLEVDHIHPVALGGLDSEDNLWLACRMCNGFKRQQTHAFDPVTRRSVRLFNPRRQKWSRHFVWSEDGTLIIGKTACGRATVVALQLNNPIAVLVRQQWVAVGWHPPH